LAHFVELDPYIVLKVLQLANSPEHVRGDGQVFNLSRAIERIGFQEAKTNIYTLVNRQMLLSKNMVSFSKLSRFLWEHSLKSAASARVLLRHQPECHLNPDEVTFAAFLHDIGAFYMLYRASKYSELVERPDTLKYLVIQWHEQIGLSLLRLFSVPEATAETVVNHDLWRDSSKQLQTVGDFVHTSNILAGAHFEWQYQDGVEPSNREQEEYLLQFSALMPEIDAENTALLAMLV
jgi:HD-like signal output (HDOD) protein